MNLEALEGFPVKTKRKGDTNLTVVMCCQIFDRRSTALSSSRFRRRPAPVAGLLTEPQTAAGIVSFVQI